MFNVKDAIHSNGCQLRGCVGFIDGTHGQISQPKYNQNIWCSGKTMSHGIKFQSLLTTDGMITSLHGPFEGKAHRIV